MSAAPPLPEQSDPISEIALGAFGVGYLFPLQRFVIANVLEGNPQIVVMPTGAGKSLCFQLPSLILPQPTLVLMPLLSLIADQLLKLTHGDFPVGILRGGLAPEEKRALWSGMKAGTVRLLLATPEACLAPSNLAALRECGIGHLVVDEAHCVSEWGDTFRPAYREVGALARRLDVGMVSAFTATASPRVVARIRELLFDNIDVRVVAGNVDRPGIWYGVTPTLSRGQALAGLVRTCEKPMLVFCRTRVATERDARSVRRCCPEVPTFFYHAGMTREERAGTESWFRTSANGCLVATCAYGMGVDKPDIRTVIHADIPSSIEAYLQESGRAGRDGKPSRAILLAGPDRARTLAWTADAFARERLIAMIEYATTTDTCRRSALLGLIGQAAVACSGCDICDGTHPKGTTGLCEILGFVGRHPRRFTIAQVGRILCGAKSSTARREFYDCFSGYAALKGWEQDHAQEAIQALIASNVLRLHARGPWKSRLSVPARATENRGLRTRIA